MRGAKRLICLLLAVLLLGVGAPERADAARTLYFTSINDMLLDLDDETMPFWANERLYIAYTAFSASDAGISASRSQDRSTVILYRQQQALTFDLSAGTVTDNNGDTYDGSAIVRGSMVFLPVDAICSYFGLMQSFTRTNYGYLVRIKTSMNVLPDATFIDAASSRMEQSYNQYQRAHEQSSTDPRPNEGNRPDANTRRTVYPVIEVTDETLTRQAMKLLSARGDRATFVFTPEMVHRSGDLVRSICGAGHAVALRAEGADASAVLAAIDEGNRELWRCDNRKTRLIFLAGASEETEKAVAGAGCCPLHCALDYTESLPSAVRTGSQIISASDRGGGSCCVCLGTDRALSAAFGELLGYLHNGNCTLERLTELTA